jgi:hypothetical protein
VSDGHFAQSSAYVQTVVIPAPYVTRANLSVLSVIGMIAALGIAGVHGDGRCDHAR